MGPLCYPDDEAPERPRQPCRDHPVYRGRRYVSATAAIIGGYGIFFTGVLLSAFLWALAYLEGIRSFRGWLIGGTATILTAGWLGRLLVQSSGYSADDFQGFGYFQILGVVGLIASAAAATFIALRMYDDFYRACPHCLASIRREASRCRHCTGEVQPAPPRHR